MKRGDRYGSWELVRRLGRGGNGEVWLAEGLNATQGAIKLLRREGADRLQRFRAEIDFALHNRDEPGIVPIVDHAIDKESGPPWFVMKVAVPMRDQLGHDPPPMVVIQAVLPIAQTLARLAARGIGHRDLKPDNLFYLDESWCVGDFGLVTYPEKEPVTKSGRRLGPIDFMAPEMRGDADRAAAGPADVYSLAKTLWVLLTSLDRPLPGPHRLDDPAYSLGTYLNHPRLVELDVLFEASTRHDPGLRPGMDEFALELDAWLQPPPERQQVVDLAALSVRIETLTLPKARLIQREADLRRSLGAALEELKVGGLEPVYQAIDGIAGLSVSCTANSGAFRAAWGYERDVAAAEQDGWACVAQAVGSPTYLIAAVGVELLTTGRLRTSATFVLEDLGVDTVRRVVWADRREARPDSSAARRGIEELNEALVVNLEVALRELATHLADR